MTTARAMNRSPETLPTHCVAMTTWSDAADHARADALADLKRITAAVAWLLGCVTALAVLIAAIPDARASMLADETKAFLDRQPLGIAGDVEIEVGEPDPRLALAPCARMQPFVPSGARMWGRTTLGVRCVEGASWSVYLPVQIRVFGPAAVTARAVARGETLNAADVRIDRVEWTAAPAGALAAPDQIEGRIATRNIAPGEALRRDALRAAPVVQPGDTVKVVLSGASFAVATEGRSLTTATEGQPVQVAIGGGKVVSGVARAGRTVEVR